MSIDVRDRRAKSDSALCQKLTNMRDDLLAFTSDPVIGPGVSYSVAHRLGLLIASIENDR
jgi:hypothetical protein